MIIKRCLFILSIIWLITAKEITLYSGEKEDGYCINNDYLFSFKNCYFSFQDFIFRDFNLSY